MFNKFLEKDAKILAFPFSRKLEKIIYQEIYHSFQQSQVVEVLSEKKIYIPPKKALVFS